METEGGGGGVNWTPAVKVKPLNFCLGCSRVRDQIERSWGKEEKKTVEIYSVK